jgi:hypothetical protein
MTKAGHTEIIIILLLLLLLLLFNSIRVYLRANVTAQRPITKLA